MPSPKLSDLTRLTVFLRDGGVCAHCGVSHKTIRQGTVDHLTPRSWGGSEDFTNLVWSCWRCNVSVKGGMDLRALAGMMMRNGLIKSARAYVARVEAIAAQPIDAEAARLALIQLRKKKV